MLSVEMHVEDLLYIAVDRTKSEAFHIKPFAMINDELVNLPRTLQYLMSKHSYPLSHGPVFLLTVMFLKSGSSFQYQNLSQKFFLPRQLSVMMKSRAALTGLL